VSYCAPWSYDHKVELGTERVQARTS